MIVGIAALIFLGVAHRVLDRMRLTDTTALLLLGALFLAPFVPNLRLAPGISVDVAGALVPLGVATYLILTADQAYERTRAMVAAVITAAAVFATEQLLPAEHVSPGGVPLSLDPLWTTGLVAGLVGYLSGRSRRASFIAGVGGVTLADLIAGAMAAARGLNGAFAAIGGGGAFDAMVIAGVLAVALAELIGETREYFARTRPSAGRDGHGGGDGGDPGGQGGGGAPTRAEPGELAGVRRNGAGKTVAGSTLTLSLLGLITAAALVAGSLQLSTRLYGPEIPEHQADRIFRMVDEGGRLVMASALPMAVGDRWIDEDNNLFEVVRMEGDTAVARALGPVALLEEDHYAQPGHTVSAASTASGALSGEPTRRAGLIDWLSGVLGRGETATGDERLILILHTHNDESYVPGDGKAIENGPGGIHEVGERLAEQLRDRGFEVIHDETLHLPHDRGAYRRSRRTILEYLGRRPALVIDLHRDAIPDPDFYKYAVDGQGVTRVRLVVGRQNPTRAQNLEFARELKAVADEKYPRFVRGIFHGKNNYNQDLGPRVILIEVGTHTNARQSAERAMRLLSDVLETYFARHTD